MKVKKQKRHRKIVRFYSACFGFREPFKILCDGTFIHHLLINQITSASHVISHTLGGQTKLFTTRCVIAELKSLGASYSGSFQAANDLLTARCDHEKRISAARCIEEVIGNDNSEHFFVATQDMDLRRKIQEVPGVPVIFGLRNTLFLDPPSESSREHANKMEEARLHVTEPEIKLLEKRGNSKVATEITAIPDTVEGLEDQVLNTRMHAKRYSRILNVEDKARFKRKKAKGPNPLSCKKKKNQENSSSASKQEHKEDDNAGRKRNRKRKRSGKSSNPGDSGL